MSTRYHLKMDVANAIRNQSFAGFTCEDGSRASRSEGSYWSFVLEKAYCHKCQAKTEAETKADGEKRCQKCGVIYWESAAAEARKTRETKPCTAPRS